MMKLFRDKNKILTFLLITSVVLLFVNLLIDKLLMHNSSKIYTSVSVSVINEDFENVLRELRVDDGWIRKKKIKKKEADSLSFAYYIRVPKDLAIPLLVDEVSKKMDIPFVRTVSFEKKINKNTTLNVFYKDAILLQAQLETDTSIARKSFSFAFIIKSVDKLNKNELDDFFKTPEEFCVILVPSLNAEYIRDKIIENQKEYLILLNDEISDRKYEFDESFSKQRLRSSVREILSNFKEAKLYLYDPGSGLYKSKVFSFIKREFKRRKLKFISLNKLYNLYAGDDKDIRTVLEERLAEGSLSNVFVINNEDLNSLQNEIEIQRLRGNKLVFPSIKNFGIEP